MLTLVSLLILGHGENDKQPGGSCHPREGGDPFGALEMGPRFRGGDRVGGGERVGTWCA